VTQASTTATKQTPLEIAFQAISQERTQNGAQISSLCFFTKGHRFFFTALD
jgi:hypothetical protein